MEPTPRKRVQHFDAEGHAHFLTFSCYRRWPLLSKERSIRWFLDALAGACAALDCELRAYIVMPEHVHLVVSPTSSSYSTSAFLQKVKQPVSRMARKWLAAHDPIWYEKLTITRGNQDKEFHFWQAGGGYDRNLFTEKELRKTVEYIHTNPIRRELVKDPLDWKWSSAAWYSQNNGLVVSFDYLRR
ncbi:MAG: hypothetical protein C4523_20050 [Myxococcales bacterium]|nr:MAG: hypothetical protein C4523_20050 [Myxococcales bacterium]